MTKFELTPNDQRDLGAEQMTKQLESLRLGWRDVPLTIALTINTLNSEGSSLGPVVSAPSKFLTVAVAAAFSISLYRKPDHEGITGSRSRQLCALIAVYAGFIVVVSVIHELPLQRYLLLGQFCALCICFGFYGVYRSEKLLGIVFTVGILHIAISLSTGASSITATGVSRLTGGSHPIQLGFEAAAVALVALTVVLSERRALVRVTFLVLFAAAVITVFAAFSRQALIGLTLSLLLIATAWPTRFRIMRAFYCVVILIFVVYFVEWSAILRILGEESTDQILAATGRSTIWDRILEARVHDPLFGYGFAAISDGVGPDSRLYYASLGANAENAVLQTFLNSGYIGLAIWSAIVYVCCSNVIKRKDHDRHTLAPILVLVLTSMIASNGASGAGVQWWWMLAIGFAPLATMRPPGPISDDRRS